MKKLTLIPFLLVTTSLTGCSFVMKWYNNASSTKTEPGFTFRVGAQDELSATIHGASPFQEKNEQEINFSSGSMEPCSFNLNEGLVYIDRYDDTKTDLTGYDPEFVNQYRRDSMTFFILNFSVNIVSNDGSSKAVYLDFYTGYTQWKFSNEKLGKAVRFAIVNPMYYMSKGLVWAPEQTADNCKYCYQDEDKVREKNYDGEDRLVAQDNFSHGGYSFEDPTSKLDYLGEAGNEDNPLRLSFYMWIEGTDPNVNNNLEDLSLNIEMNFNFRIY